MGSGESVLGLLYNDQLFGSYPIPTGDQPPQENLTDQELHKKAALEREQRYQALSKRLTKTSNKKTLSKTRRKFHSSKELTDSITPVESRPRAIHEGSQIFSTK